LSAIPLNIEGLEIKEQEEETEEAETEQSLRAQMMLYNSTLGPDDPKTLTSMEKLAAKLRKRGQLEEAKILQMRLVEAYKSKYGESHPDTIRYMDSLASTFQHQGRFEEAQSLQLQVMEACLLTFGRHDHKTLASMAHLAEIWDQMGRVREATNLRKECILLQMAVPESDRRNTMSSLLTLNQWQEGQSGEGRIIQPSVSAIQRRAS
jgi:hypothetical protein